MTEGTQPDREKTARAAGGAVDGEFGPWRPGLRSPIPRDLEPLTTLYREEHAFRGAAQTRELADFSGLARDRLVDLRPERLITHELLVRVAASISVPDGPDSEDLGVHFREICATIASRYIEPALPGLKDDYAALRARLDTGVRAELSRLDPPPPVKTTSGSVGGRAGSPVCWPASALATVGASTAGRLRLPAPLGRPATVSKWPGPSSRARSSTTGGA